MTDDQIKKPSRLTFFSREPKFSTWIILGSLLLLSLVMIYMSCDYQTPISEIFCSHTDKPSKLGEVLNFKGLYQQITSELRLMPK